MQIRRHRNRTAHKLLADRGIYLAIYEFFTRFLNSSRRLPADKTTASGIHRPATDVLDRDSRIQFFLESLRPPHGGPVFSICEDIVILACTRVVSPKRLHFFESRTFFQSSTHQCCHRNAVPLPFASATHFTSEIWAPFIPLTLPMNPPYPTLAKGM